MDTVSSNDFSLEILLNGICAPKHLVDRANYFSLHHGDEYKIRLLNNKSVRADAHVYIDGERVGVWRLSPHKPISIERPSDSNKKFTFLKENTCDAHDGGIESGKEANGLVKVIFKPEKYHNCDCALFDYDENEVYKTMHNQSYSSLSAKSKRSMNFSNSLDSYRGDISTNSTNSTNFSAGGTALGTHSFQQFGNTSQLYDIDYANVTTLLARLVISNSCNVHDTKFVPLHKKTSVYPLRISDTSHDHACNCNCLNRTHCRACHSHDHNRGSYYDRLGRNYFSHINY